MKISKTILKQAKHLFTLCLREDRLDSQKFQKVINHLSKMGSLEAKRLLVGLRVCAKKYIHLHSALVSSAEELPHSFRKKIEEKISSLYGEDFSVAYQIDGSLIGGLRIQIGDDVYDSSLVARVEQFKLSFRD